MSSKNASSLKELKGLREAVLAEEKAKTQARLQSLPPNQATLVREEVALPSPASLDPQDELSEEAVLSQPPPPKPQAPPPNNLRPVAASAPTTAPPRNKVSQEPALIIPLTPKIRERLQRHVENSRWSQADLVIELIRAFLHRGYPEIQLGDQLIAQGGTYRTFERSPLDTILKIVSGQGVFNIAVRPEHPEFQNWLSYFADQKNSNPERAAQQACLFALQTDLESVEDYKPNAWTKNIPPDSYTLAPVG